MLHISYVKTSVYWICHENKLITKTWVFFGWLSRYYRAIKEWVLCFLYPLPIARHCVFCVRTGIMLFEIFKRPDNMAHDLSVDVLSWTAWKAGFQPPPLCPTFSTRVWRKLLSARSPHRNTMTIVCVPSRPSCPVSVVHKTRHYRIGNGTDLLKQTRCVS